jgi:hypothetical protein
VAVTLVVVVVMGVVAVMVVVGHRKRWCNLTKHGCTAVLLLAATASGEVIGATLVRVTARSGSVPAALRLRSSPTTWCPVLLRRRQRLRLRAVVTAAV